MVRSTCPIGSFYALGRGVQLLVTSFPVKPVPFTLRDFFHGDGFFDAQLRVFHKLPATVYMNIRYLYDFCASYLSELGAFDFGLATSRICLGPSLNFMISRRATMGGEPSFAVGSSFREDVNEILAKAVINHINRDCHLTAGPISS